MAHHLVLSAALAATLLLGAGLPAFSQPAAPPPGVTVRVLTPRSVPVVSELPGRIAATRVSEVRARVGGILQERVFEQGARVNQGDILYRIDPKLFRVRVASAEAALRRAQAVQLNAKQQYERRQTLRDRGISTAADFETSAAQLAQADADVAAAEAALDEARINLGYTEIRAPISGIIGSALVTEGALVTAEGSQNLALIQQLDPVYADFMQSSGQLLALKRALEEGKLAGPAPGQASVTLLFDNGQPYQLPGKLLFANANVDRTTGQIMLRAEFPNPRGDLLPGMYVRIRIEQAVQHGAIVVPQRAVIRNAEGAAQVYVVGQGDIAEVRDVVLGSVVGNEWVVESGLKPGERIVVDGAQKVQAGAAVSPGPAEPEARSAGQSEQR